MNTTQKDGQNVAQKDPTTIAKIIKVIPANKTQPEILNKKFPLRIANNLAEKFFLPTGSSNNQKIIIAPRQKLQIVGTKTETNSQSPPALIVKQDQLFQVKVNNNKSENSKEGSKSNTETTSTSTEDDNDDLDVEIRRDPKTGKDTLIFTKKDQTKDNVKNDDSIEEVDYLETDEKEENHSENTNSVPLPETADKTSEVSSQENSEMITFNKNLPSPVVYSRKNAQQPKTSSTDATKTKSRLVFDPVYVPVGEKKMYSRRPKTPEHVYRQFNLPTTFPSKKPLLSQKPDIEEGEVVVSSDNATRKNETISQPSQITTASQNSRKLIFIKNPNQSNLTSESAQPTKTSTPPLSYPEKPTLTSIQQNVLTTPIPISTTSQKIMFIKNNTPAPKIILQNQILQQTETKAPLNNQQKPPLTNNQQIPPLILTNNNQQKPPTNQSVPISANNQPKPPNTSVTISTNNQKIMFIKNNTPTLKKTPHNQTSQQNSSKETLNNKSFLMRPLLPKPSNNPQNQTSQQPRPSIETPTNTSLTKKSLLHSKPQKNPQSRHMFVNFKLEKVTQPNTPNTPPLNQIVLVPNGQTVNIPSITGVNNNNNNNSTTSHVTEPASLDDEDSASDKIIANAMADHTYSLVCPSVHQQKVFTETLKSKSIYNLTMELKSKFIPLVGHACTATIIDHLSMAYSRCRNSHVTALRDLIQYVDNFKKYRQHKHGGEDINETDVAAAANSNFLIQDTFTLKDKKTVSTQTELRKEDLDKKYTESKETEKKSQSASASSSVASQVPFTNLITIYKEWKNATVPDGTGNMPIHRAVMENDMEAVKRQCIILKKMNNINIQNEFQHMTALHLAVTSQADIDIVDMLIAHGANPEIQDLYGNNCIHLAVRYGTVELVDYILEHHKYDTTIINTCNFDGLTPLMLCAEYNKFEIAEKLLTNYANPNIQNPKSGRTVLFQAIESNNQALVELLIQHGADPRKRDFSGVAPQDAATELETEPDIRHIIYKVLSQTIVSQQRKRQRLVNYMNDQARKSRRMVDSPTVSFDLGIDSENSY